MRAANAIWASLLFACEANPKPQMCVYVDAISEAIKPAQNAVPNAAGAALEVPDDVMISSMTDALREISPALLDAESKASHLEAPPFDAAARALIESSVALRAESERALASLRVLAASAAPKTELHRAVRSALDAASSTCPELVQPEELPEVPEGPCQVLAQELAGLPSMLTPEVLQSFVKRIEPPSRTMAADPVLRAIRTVKKEARSLRRQLSERKGNAARVLAHHQRLLELGQQLEDAEQRLQSLCL